MSDPKCEICGGPAIAIWCGNVRCEGHFTDEMMEAVADFRERNPEFMPVVDTSEAPA